MHEQIIPRLLAKKSFIEKEIRPPIWCCYFKVQELLTGI